MDRLPTDEQTTDMFDAAFSTKQTLDKLNFIRQVATRIYSSLF